MKSIDSTNNNNKKNTGTFSPEVPADLTNTIDIRVIRILATEGPMTRNQLVTKTGIARSTLYDSLLRLILKKYVSKYSERPQGPGRPKVFFQVYDSQPSGNPAPVQTYS